MLKKSAHSFICQHSLIQRSCDASLRCSLLRGNGIAVSEMKLNLTMHASSKKQVLCKRTYKQNVQTICFFKAVQCPVLPTFPLCCSWYKLLHTVVYLRFQLQKRKNKHGKEKKLTTSCIKIQVLQNIASGLENTENATVTLMDSCAISGEHTLLPQLTGQGSDSSMLVRLWQTYHAQLCTNLSTLYLHWYLSST